MGRKYHYKHDLEVSWWMGVFLHREGHQSAGTGCKAVVGIQLRKCIETPCGHCGSKWKKIALAKADEAWNYADKNVSDIQNLEDNKVENEEFKNAINALWDAINNL